MEPPAVIPAIVVIVYDLLEIFFGLVLIFLFYSEQTRFNILTPVSCTQTASSRTTEYILTHPRGPRMLGVRPLLVRRNITWYVAMLVCLLLFFSIFFKKLLE